MRISRRDQSGRVSATGGPKGSARAPQTPSTPGQGPSGADGVSISPKAAEVQQAKAALESMPDTRVEVVAAIQDEIEDGTYHRDSQEIAKRIVNEHLRQSIESKSR